MEQNKKAVF